MVDALRRRADTHTPSNRRQDEEPTERTSFLGLPSPYGGFLLPNSVIHSGSKGLLTCFFWCGHTEGIEGEQEEDEEDLCIGMPDYLFGRRLGQGRQGEVRHAIQRSDGQSVAVKCVRRNRHLDHDQVEDQGILEEAAVLSRLSHSSIVRLLRFETLPTCDYLVLELLDGGQLLEAVAGLATYTEHDARQIAIALLKGLAHAHDSARCVHRDLRPEKLLLSRDPIGVPGSVGKRVKIAGWGRSKRLPQDGLLPGEPFFGMRALSAPEMLLGELHGAPADMFAMGAILYTLLSGSPPRSAGLVAAINPVAPDFSGPAWGGVSGEAKDLVGALMTPKGPAARLTAKNALRHSWIKANERALRMRSLDAVLKGARVFSWRGAMQGDQWGGNGGQPGRLPRVRSMF